MSEIKLTDTLMDIIMKMSKGNPGAVNVLMAMMTEGKNIDPDAADAFLLSMVQLDDLGIRGTDIYVLANDSCNRDLRNLFVLLRANQLGFLTTERLLKAAKDQTRQHAFSEEELDEFDKKVCAELPNFKRAEVAKAG